MNMYDININTRTGIISYNEEILYNKYDLYYENYEDDIIFSEKFYTIFIVNNSDIIKIIKSNKEDYIYLILKQNKQKIYDWYPFNSENIKNIKRIGSYNLFNYKTMQDATLLKEFIEINECYLSFVR
jgi:hypothetical protein